TGTIAGIRQRETAISLIATTTRYAAYALALVLSLAALSGGHRLQTVLGASFLAIMIAFAAQRFLTDVIAGLLMFFEGWFRIGDTVRSIRGTRKEELRQSRYARSRCGASPARSSTSRTRKWSHCARLLRGRGRPLHNRACARPGARRAGRPRRPGRDDA